MTGKSMCGSMHWWLGRGKGIVCISGCKLDPAARDACCVGYAFVAGKIGALQGCRGQLGASVALRLQRHAATGCSSRVADQASLQIVQVPWCVSCWLLACWGD